MIRALWVRAAAAPDPAAAHLKRLSNTGRSSNQGTRDLQVARQMSAQHNVPLEETVEHIAALRLHEPSRNDRWHSFADLTAPLNFILTGATAEQRKATCDRLLQLHVGSIGAAAAQQHDEALRAVGDDGAAIRDGYIKRLAKESHNGAAFLDMLGAIRGTPNARQQFATFGALLDLTKNPTQAVADLRLVQTITADLNVPYSTVAHVLTELRGADPGRKDRYAHFCALDQPARYVLAAADPSAKLSEFLSLQARKRSPAEVLPHAQRLDAVPAATATAYRDLLGRYEKSDDNHLLQALGEAGVGPQGASVLGCFGSLEKASGRCQQAATDLHVALGLAGQPGAVPLAEIIEHAVHLRKHDPSQKYHSYQPLEVEMAAILPGATPAERERRRGTFEKLLAASREAQTAAQDMQWITAAADDPGDAAATLLRLRQARYGNNEIKAVFDLARQAARNEPRGFFQRWWRRPGTMEKLALRLLQKGSGDVAAAMENLAQSRFPDESIKSASKRWNWLFKKGGRYATARPVIDALQRVQAPLPWGDMAAATRWKTFKGLVKEVGSLAGATTVWQIMAGAQWESEFHARRQAFSTLKTISKLDGADAKQLYDVLCLNLGARDSIDERMSWAREVVTKVKDVHTPTAMLRKMLDYRNLPAPDRACVDAVYRQATSHYDVGYIDDVLQRPVENESLAWRAALLQDGLRAFPRQVHTAVGAYNAASTALHPTHEFEAAAPAMMELIAALHHQKFTPPWAPAAQTVQWLHEEKLDVVPDHPHDDVDEPGMVLAQRLRSLAADVESGASLEQAKQRLLQRGLQP